MLYRGSYHNGFAPRDFAPAYPELWKGCVGAWRPSLGPTGAVLRDWSGSQQHGTLTGTTLDDAWTPNGGAYSLLLDGVDAYAVISKTSALSPTDAVSVSAWVRYNATGDFDVVIANKNSIGDQGWLLYYHGVLGKMQFAINGYALNAAGTTVTADGLWHHFVGTYSVVDGLVSIYMDGVLANQKAYSTAVGYTGTACGIGNVDGFTFWDGHLDDIRVYNRALSQHEITLLYTNGSGRGIAYSYNQPRFAASSSSGSAGGTFPGLAWWALRRWRFVVRAGVDVNCPIVR